MQVTTQIKLASGSAVEFMQILFRRVDSLGEKIHKTWYEKKKIEFDNAFHPFKGAPPADSPFANARRVRVRELDLVQATQLGVVYDPEDARDVYHALYVDHTKLEARDKGKNIIPPVAVIQYLVDKLGADATLLDLEGIIEDILNGSTKFALLLREELKVVVHIAWAAGEVVYGERYPQNQDLILFHQLPDGTKSSDWDLAKVVLEWILEEARNLHRPGKFK